MQADRCRYTFWADWHDPTMSGLDAHASVSAYRHLGNYLWTPADVICAAKRFSKALSNDSSERGFVLKHIQQTRCQADACRRGM